MAAALDVDAPVPCLSLRRDRHNRASHAELAQGGAGDALDVVLVHTAPTENADSN
jgi:hypothetical protein